MVNSLLSQLIICVLFALPCYASSKEENFLLIDGTSNAVIMEFGPCISKQVSPCSTFKIPLHLMGYDAAILEDEIKPVWDFEEGYDDWLVSWRSPQSPSSWIKCSCIWYSKILSLKLGLEKIQNYITAFDYGNQDASGGLAEPGPLSPFWVNSSIKISPKEQVDFLQKMILAQLPISSRAIQMTKAVLFKEKISEDWKLFGKTGWTGSDVRKDGKTLEHSWFVGWIEKDHLFYPFAYLIRSEENINLDERIPRVKCLLVDSGVMNEASINLHNLTNSIHQNDFASEK